MSRHIKLFLFSICGLILSAILLGSRLTQDNLSAPQLETQPPYRLKRDKAIKIDLPAGDYAGQAGTDIVFLSTVWLNGRLPTEAIAFSIDDQRERWRTELSAPPLQALDAGDAYLIATANQDGSGHLVSLAREDGRILWDRPLGDSIVALARKDSRIWALTAQSIRQVNPDTGEMLADVVVWDKPPTPSDWRVLVAHEEGNLIHLAASAGKDIYSYVKTDTGWNLRWRFRAANSVLELQLVKWRTDEAPHLLALAHSSVYDIQPDGTAAWHLDNHDLNQDAQPVRCDESETRFVFRNVVSGVYLVDRNGLVRAWELPGGATRLGPIHLPIPANPAMGLAVADLTGDGLDEIIARSVTRLFVFDCEANLIASAPLNEGSGEKFVSKLRNSPRYRPFVVDGQLVVAEKGQISYFSLEPNSEFRGDLP
ncbi:MAG: hypothetical protein RMK99_02195 [Anaerolineales bacterium]|nr:hypothetical protein [Anaerolineales bacterium]